MHVAFPTPNQLKLRLQPLQEDAADYPAPPFPQLEQAKIRNREGSKLP
ncbi:hypothetical protein ADIAG_00254 [Paeniglutamicibacter gangotriensis Lz1y]|uniref:Uncharacterized protein n=1 Tax=Paeniglutamicibacter gangotriensis Lz1y TaxID=1276920 RepID=M7MYY4_9MICC|nr:hypothetical protein ADIAG_00254 [Paeniglutamicibacter gangotriensis Lz1y]